MNKLEIHYQPLNELKPYARNARVHSKKQIRQVAGSIKRYGFNNSILIDDDMMILAGHCRFEAAKQLGMKTVPCVRLSSMSDAEKRAYIIADNKHAQNAGWDEELLAGELQALIEMDPSFDCDELGFAPAELDAIIDGLLPEEAGDPKDDDIPDLQGPARCQIGDIWQLGDHRLVSGNMLDEKVACALMRHEKARMVFTDPPYNLKVNGHVGGLGKTKHREFEMASGDMTDDEFVTFLAQSIRILVQYSMSGSIHFLCMDWRHIAHLLKAATANYTEQKNLIAWVKDNGGMGTFYRSRHELIAVFKSGSKHHINNFELGQHGRYRTNVWEYKGVNTLKAGRMDELSMHPTVKPVQMIADAIKDCSARRDIILDIFAGSGSTLIAAHKTGRRAYVGEIDPVYCDTIIKRWETYARDEAVKIGEVDACTVATASEAGT